MKFKFISIASGSSGNCFYLGTSSYGILIDSGIGIRMVRKVLRERGISIEAIMGIFVTHDHADHVRSVGNLSEQFNIPVYTTSKIHSGMERCYCMTKKVAASNKRILVKDESTIIRDFKITPFEVPHDGTDNVGYSIECGDEVNFCFITDIGHITDTVKHYVAKAQYLILEANYDEQMLAEGPYPPLLQMRINGPNGHLSNHAAGEFLANHFPPMLKQIWLCHLSKENNKPHLAYHTVADALRRVGKEVDRDVRLMALPRTSPTQIFEIPERDNRGEGFMASLFD